MSATPRLSVVLPCYNEARGLEALVQRFAEAGHGVPFELILVDNGSTDDTAAVLARLVERHPFARSVKVPVNQGYGHGILTGLKAAAGETLAWSHADLQTDPADVFRAWDLYRQSADPRRAMVKGRRVGRSFQERIITWGMQTLATILLRTPMYEINAQPKLFHRELLGALSAVPKDWSFDLYVLYAAKRCGWKCSTFPVEFPPRKHGGSNWASSWRSKVRTIARAIRYLVKLAGQPRPRLADGAATPRSAPGVSRPRAA